MQLPRQQQANDMLTEQDGNTYIAMFCLQIHVHADFESLQKEVPKRLLPQEYGGEAGPMEVLIGECGVFRFCIKKFVYKKKQSRSFL
jgi:hypothetical protein